MKRLSLFITLSFIIHLPLLAIGPLSNNFKLPKNKKMMVSLIKIPKHKKEDVKELIKEEELIGQVVDLPPDTNSDRPEDAKFLSETNHKTERETISRHKSLDAEKSGHEKTVAKNIEDSAKAIGADEIKQDELHKKEMPNKNKLSLEVDNGTLKNPKDNKNKDSENKEQVDNGARKINLFPDQKTLSRISSAPFADHVEDVEEGEGTFLNTLQFKHAGFFNRIKKEVANRWKPGPEIRHRDPTGNIYGIKDRRTLLSVVLDADGNILNVTIKITSGVDFIDDGAVKAFYKVKQFPNPPDALIKDGKVKFNFGFNINFRDRFKMAF